MSLALQSPLCFFVCHNCYFNVKKGHFNRASSLKGYLSKAEFAVKVLIHLLDHVLQGQVSLWGSQLLRHHLQLHQVNEAILPRVIPGHGREGEGRLSITQYSY